MLLGVACGECDLGVSRCGCMCCCDNDGATDVDDDDGQEGELKKA